MSKLSLRYGIAAGIMIAASAAQAADMPVKAVAPVVAVYNWTGIYGGIQGGYGKGMKEWTNNSFDYDVSGFFAGGTIGINQQIGNWVIGLEADASWSNIKGSQTLTVGAPGNVFTGLQTVTVSTNIDSIVTAAGRLGLAQDRWLVYIKGGAGWARETHSENAFFDFPGAFPQTGRLVLSGSETRFGPVVGIGAEHALYGNWSFKSEYNYLHFLNGSPRLAGTFTLNGVTQPIFGNEDIRQAIHLAKFGLNYRFGPDSPPAIAPVRPAPGYNWTGFYIGAEGGWALGRKTWEDPDLNPFDVKGWFAGGVTGTNVQAGAFVVGAESEWLFAGIRGSGGSFVDLGGGVTQATNVSTRVDWMSLNSLRLGFVAADRWLVYVKGGVALAKETHSLTQFLNGGPLGFVSNTFSGTALHTGGLAGIGVEYAFLGNWSAKLEYNYIHFRAQDISIPGSTTFNIPGQFVGTVAAFDTHTIGQDLHLFKVGLNYKLDGWLDVVRAKY